MHKAVIISLLLLSQVCNAQFVEKLSYYTPHSHKTGNPDQGVSFKLEESITSLTVRISSEFNFEDCFIVAESDTFRLQKDEHGPENDEKFCCLVIFPEPVKSFSFFQSDIRDSVNIFTINDLPKSGVLRNQQSHGNYIKSSAFEMPEMIDQEDWREGLKAPDFERIVHTVNNVIVHHSASSNLVTDYRTAVRNIYLYHTEVRRWSDIGYNYVIAANGDIFKGRDPGVYDQDVVMGAHFCSNNRGTMGICMLGTFTEIAPTDTAFASLEKILVWKLGKDEMDALGQYAHPLNDDLNVISGHRDGCATECPGEVMYSRLHLLRDRVNNKIILTGIELIADPATPNNEIHLFPNPVEHQLSITSANKINQIIILSLSGQKIKSIHNPTDEIDLSFVSSGTYLLKIISGDKVTTRRIVRK